MVPGDDFGELLWQMPIGGNDLPAFTMRSPQHPLFCFMQRNAALTCFLEASAEIIRSDPKHGDDANIMQKPCSVSLGRVGIADADCELTGDYRASQGMRPESGWVDAA